MADLRTVLTETLDGHWSVRVKVEVHNNVHVARHICHCGESYVALAEHLADVLLGLSGVAVVALPEPGDDDGDGLLWPGISGHPGLYVSTTDPDGLVYDDESSFLPAEALDIAGQWASAAAAAAGVFSEGATND